MYYKQFENHTYAKIRNKFQIIAKYLVYLRILLILLEFGRENQRKLP